MKKMHETKTVLLIKGASQYDAMRNYLDEIADGFQQIGYPSVVIDAEHDFFYRNIRWQPKHFIWIMYYLQCKLLSGLQRFRKCKVCDLFM